MPSKIKISSQELEFMISGCLGQALSRILQSFQQVLVTVRTKIILEEKVLTGKILAKESLRKIADISAVLMMTAQHMNIQEMKCSVHIGSVKFLQMDPQEHHATLKRGPLLNQNPNKNLVQQAHFGLFS